MNLTDGKVLCGRRYFDGSGGNNHALLHFQEMGYPLAVKLGTITPDGAGKQITAPLLDIIRHINIPANLTAVHLETGVSLSL